MLVLRYLDKDGKSYGGFQNLLNPGDINTAPDWDPKKECGNGLHGWIWGLGREGKSTSVTEGLWQVCEPIDDGVDLGGKWKWQALKVVKTGTFQECNKILTNGRIKYLIESATSGDGSSAATSGYGSSAATSGDGSSAATSGGGSSAATSGLSAPAVACGLDCKAKAGPFGCIALGWWNKKENRMEMVCAEVGDGSYGLKPHTWYKVNDNREFEEILSE